MKPARGPWLDYLPSPYLGGVFQLDHVKSVYLDISRGCPFTCQFCSIGIDPGSHFSLERISAELKYVLEHAPLLERIACISFDLMDHPQAAAMLGLFRAAAESRNVEFRFDVNIRNLSRLEKVAWLDSSRFSVDVGIQASRPEALRTSGRIKGFDWTTRGVEAAKKLAPNARLILGFIRGLPVTRWKATGML